MEVSEDGEEAEVSAAAREVIGQAMEAEQCRWSVVQGGEVLCSALKYSAVKCCKQ